MCLQTLKTDCQLLGFGLCFSISNAGHSNLKLFFLIFFMNFVTIQLNVFCCHIAMCVCMYVCMAYI